MAERTYYAYLTLDEADDPRTAGEQLGRMFDGRAARDGFQRVGPVAFHPDERVRVDGLLLFAATAEIEPRVQPRSQAS